MQSVCKYVYANTQKIYWCTEETIGNAKNYFKSEEGGTTKKKKNHLGYQTETVCVFLTQSTSPTTHLIGFLSKNQ